MYRAAGDGGSGSLPGIDLGARFLCRRSGGDVHRAFREVLGLEVDFFLFCLECVEGVYPAVGPRVTWRPSAFKNERQMLKRLFLPCSHVRQDVSHRPFPGHAAYHQLCFGQARACLLKFGPSLVKSFQEPSFIHNSILQSPDQCGLHDERVFVADRAEEIGKSRLYLTVAV